MFMALLVAVVVKLMTVGAMVVVYMNVANTSWQWWAKYCFFRMHVVKMDSEKLEQYDDHDVGECNDFDLAKVSN